MDQLSYVVITPTRDEERTVEDTLRSMIAQKVKPLRWIIVNDGSTDRTREIVESHLPGNDWIRLVEREDRGFRALGGGVVDAFDFGFSHLDESEWDFVVKLDADLRFGEDYFERMLQRFEDDPELGMASGKTYLIQDGVKTIEWCHDDHVRGPAKMYKRECYERIGGLEPVRGWDMIDETKAQMLGYRTKSFIEEEIIHLRPIDARQPKVLQSRFEMGKLYHFLGYHWLYHAVRSARSALQDFPILVGGLLLFSGYVVAALQRRERYDPDYTRFVHEKQLERFNLGHLRKYLRTTGRQ